MGTTIILGMQKANNIMCLVSTLVSANHCEAADIWHRFDWKCLCRGFHLNKSLSTLLDHLAFHMFGHKQALHFPTIIQ